MRNEQTSAENMTSRDSRYSNFLTDALYESIPGFVVLFTFKDEIELIDANNQFYQFFGMEKINSPLKVTKGDNSLFDALYEHETDIKSGKNAMFSCPLKHIEGHTDWYYIKTINPDIENTYFAICIDISDQKRLQEQLEEEKQRYKIALDCSEDTIFEYDANADLLITYGDFGNASVSKETVIQLPNFKLRLMRGEITHLDDVDKIIKATESREGINSDVRVIYGSRKSSEFKWAHVEGVLLSSQENSRKFVGKITNIHERKMEELRSMETLHIDHLTGIYNNERMEYLVEQYSSFLKKEKYAIMVFDLHKFSVINENYGRYFGDVVLKDITAALKARIRNTDVIGRIGGDEFMLLVKSSGRLDLVKYARTISENILPDYFGGSDEEIKLNVGIAEVMRNENWENVIEHAKQTLMFVKQHPEDNVRTYASLVEEGLHSGLKLEFKPSEHFNNEIVTRDDIDGMVSFALDLLERSKDAKQAMSLLLIRILKVLGLSAASVYETDFTFFVSTSHYRVREGILQENNQIQHNSRANMDALYSRADEDGFIYVSKQNVNEQVDELKEYFVTSKAQEILLSVIYNEGMPRGFIEFSSKKEGAFGKEIRLRLKEVAKIIATHINKANSDAASKMKSDFLSRMSHEIRTPMNAIIGMTEIATSCINDEERVLDSLSKIGTSTKYLLSLVNDILDMSKIESGKQKLNIEQFNLSRLIDSIDLLVRPQAEKKKINFKIIRDFTEELVYGDEIKITQVLVNLASNALKFTGEKGKIILRVEQLMNEDDAVVYRFLMKDTGIGIDSKNLQRIFMAFEQAEDDTGEKFGGTGLGLAISSNLIQLMESRIEVKSHPGKGSEFYFNLSLKKHTEKSAENHDAKASEADENYDFTGKRILIAEDNELNAEIAETILNMAGFETEIAVNGEEALRLFTENPENYYDAILMDIRMPVMDGLEAARRIRELKRKDAEQIPIIAMTANAYDDDMKKSIKSGMDAHLSKPIDTRMLYSTLKEKLINERKA